MNSMKLMFKLKGIIATYVCYLVKRLFLHKAYSMALYKSYVKRLRYQILPWRYCIAKTIGAKAAMFCKHNIIYNYYYHIIYIYLATSSYWILTMLYHGWVFVYTHTRLYRTSFPNGGGEEHRDRARLTKHADVWIKMHGSRFSLFAIKWYSKRQMALNDFRFP